MSAKLKFFQPKIRNLKRGYKEMSNAADHEATLKIGGLKI